MDSSQTGTDMLRLRGADAGDAATIVAYNRALARETEHRDLDEITVTRGVEALLADPQLGRYVLAEKAGQVVGQLMLTREWSDWRNGTFWWIQSVYVHPDHRQSGVFRSLFEHVYSQAAAEDAVCGLRLYVEEHNERAQATYARLGADLTGYRIMEWLLPR